MSPEKRDITPHKGGRTTRLPTGRVTQEEKQMIDEARGDQSFADWVVAQAKKILGRRKQTN